MDWSKAIQIDRSWPTNLLNHHFTEVNGKVTICLHSISACGTEIRSDGLVEKLHDLLPDFALGRKRIAEIGSSMKIAAEASKYFGDTDPSSDGKYGELLLFALVEALLGCKMIAHKIRSISNMSDQVKGGDGIFLGNYLVAENNMQSAYLIGESKVVSNFNNGLPSAFESIYRFHDPKTSYQFRNTEFLVTKDNLILDDDIDIDELYNRLNRTSSEFKNQILVHPVLIMYNSGKVAKCEREAVSKEQLEMVLAQELDKIRGGLTKSVNNQLVKYTELQNVHLHFFMLPFNNVDAFRNAMYSQIHMGVSYQPKK